jgi:hypothetical protein
LGLPLLQNPLRHLLLEPVLLPVPELPLQVQELPLVLLPALYLRLTLLLPHHKLYHLL